MADFPDRKSLFAVGRRSIVTTPNLKINPKMIDIPGTDINIAIGAMAMMGEDLATAFVACMASLFVETASGPALDRVAYDRYQLTRQPSAPATVTLQLTRPTFAFGAFTLSAGTRVQTADGTQFSTDVDVVFGGTTLTGVVTATALVAGPGGNVAKLTLTQFVDQPADATLRSTNADSGTPGTRAYIPGGAAGGVDVETDPDFRARILGFFPTVRRGTLGAIEYGAFTVPGVAVAKAIEVTNDCSGEPMPAAAVQLIVADRNGGFSATMLQQVRDALLTFRAEGIPVFVTGGEIRYVPVKWVIGYLVGANQAQVREQVRAVTVAVAQFLRPAESLLRSALLAGARTVPGAVIYDHSLPDPLGDTHTTANYQLIRIDPNAVAFGT